MAENENPNAGLMVAGSTGEGKTPPAETAPVETAVTPEADAPDTVDYKADAEKWKALSRKNEEAYKQASAELKKFQEASMSEAEKALAAAREEGRNAALQENLTERAQDKLDAAAAKAGVDVSDLMDVLDLNKFISGNSLDADAIEKFVSRFADKKPKQDKGKPASELGVGQQGSAPPQLRREDLKGMSPQAIAQAESEGRLDSLKKGI